MAKVVVQPQEKVVKGLRMEMSYATMELSTTSYGIISVMENVTLTSIFHALQRMSV